MKNLAVKAQLSTLYTNHSIRSTSITTWDEHNIEARHICGVSGHKSEETIRCYSKKCPPKKKREMADIISKKLGNPIKKQKTMEEYEREQAEKIVENANFEDWVPIDNNINDFDVSNILKEIENQTKNYEVPQPDQNQMQIAIPNEIPAVSSALVPTNPPPPVVPQPSSSNQVLNVSNAQNYPVLPKMFFPNSNVTINYNFNAPKQ